MNSNRKTAIFVGILFLVATVTFMIGSMLIQSYFTSEYPSKMQLVAGALLEIFCGLAVVAIGVLMFPILKKYNKSLAFSYVILRIIEFAAIIFSGVYLLHFLKILQNYDLMIYIFTGIGGLIFSYLLYQSKLIPKCLSVLGLVGYFLLLMGVLLDILSCININTGAGMLLYLPGGLFELLLPIWLFVKGFNTPIITS